MELHTEGDNYSFDTSQYENWDLEETGLTVREVTEPEEMREAASDTGSCLLWESESDLQDYLSTFTTWVHS